MYLKAAKLRCSVLGCRFWLEETGTDFGLIKEACLQFSVLGCRFWIEEQTTGNPKLNNSSLIQ